MRRIALVLLPVLLIGCRSAPELADTANADETAGPATLLPEDFPVIRVERGGFSPNGDGLFDTVSLVPEVKGEDNLAAWTVAILDDGDQEVRRFADDGSLVDRIVWDGLDDGSDPAPEGVYRGRFTTDFGPAGRYEATTAPFVLVLDGPDVTLSIEDGAFSPDGDGVDDTYIVGIDVAVPAEVADWEIAIRDPAGTPYVLDKRIGPPPAEWIWDGMGADGSRALSGADYPIRLVVTDMWGNETVMNWQVHVDVFAIPDGDRFIISLSRIFFQPYTADFNNVPEDERKSNEKTLEQVASILRSYARYDVQLVGHAVHVYWYRPNLMAREQKDILLPLSLARAEAIRDALIGRGIDASRLSVEGRGGSEPLVPHSDLRNRWQNRRVVFYLTP